MKNKALTSREQVMGLLNEIWLSGRMELSLKYAGIELFNINLKTGDIKAITRRAYDENIISKYSEILGQELPSYSDVMLAAKTAGIFRIANEDEIRQAISKNIISRDILAGDKRIFIFYDTCVLRERLNDYISGLLPVDKKDTNCLLTTGVRKELYSYGQRKTRPKNPEQRQYPDDLTEIDTKYKKVFIDKAKEDLAFFSNFFNQSMLEARRRRIGLVEYKKLLARRHATEIDSGYGDRNLISKSSLFAEKNKVDILAVTSDENFGELCRINKINAVRLKYGTMAGKVSWENARDLVFFSAILFGFVNLNGINLSGIWVGKGQSEWDNEQISVSWQ